MLPPARLLLSDCFFFFFLVSLRCSRLFTAGSKKPGAPGNMKLLQRQEDLWPEMGKAQEKVFQCGARSPSSLHLCL